MNQDQVTAAANGYGWLTPPQAAATNALFGFGSGGGGGFGGGAGGSGGAPSGGNPALPNIYIQDLPPASANPGDLWIQGATAWGANENGDWQRPGGETETSTSVIGYYGPFASANAGTGGAVVGNSDLNAAIYAGVAGLGLWASRNVALSEAVATAGRALAPVGAVLDLTPQGRTAAVISGVGLLGAGALYGLSQRQSGDAVQTPPTVFPGAEPQKGDYVLPGSPINEPQKGDYVLPGSPINEPQKGDYVRPGSPINEPQKGDYVLPGPTIGDVPVGPLIQAAIGPTDLQGVAGYLKQNGTLPPNYIDKKTAQSLGWIPKLGNLDQVAPGMSIGGDPYKNLSGALPSDPARTWYEADLNYVSGYRGDERILYSSDGLIYYTNDHYKTFTEVK